MATDRQTPCLYYICAGLCKKGRKVLIHMSVQWNYTDFNIENHNITFDNSEKDGVLISIPFADDTAQCIKDKLNEIISQGMDEWARLGTWNGILKGYMPAPKDLLLNARMQIRYDHELGVQYYIVATITELIPDVKEIWIDKEVLVTSLLPELHNELVSYCRYKLDKILFPSW